MQEKLKVKIKKLNENAVVPKYAIIGDAGMDLTATSREWNDTYQCWEYGTGIAIQIPKGYVGLIFPRSSIFKTGVDLSNSVAVVDSGYTGEIKAYFNSRTTTFAGFKTFFNLLFERTEKLSKNIRICHYDKTYKIGDRIGQIIIMPYPHVEFEEVNELEQTERGEGGFGSSGK